MKRSPAAKAIPFAVEQGLVSLPDMAAALTNLPAYVLARTGELAGARADADLRKEATVGDLVAALPGAAAAALLERLGARGMMGLGDALKARSVRGVAGAAGRGSALEGGTETGQEGIEHLTARLGTATGLDAREMADAMMAGGAAGAIFGGGVRGATATGEALLGRPQVRQAGAGAPPALPVPVRLTGEELAPFDVPIGDLRAEPRSTGTTKTWPIPASASPMSMTGGRFGSRAREHRKPSGSARGCCTPCPAFPMLLRTGRPLGSQPDRQGREVIRAWHRYAATPEVAGRRHVAVLVVRERPRRHVPLPAPAPLFVIAPGPGHRRHRPE